MSRPIRPGTCPPQLASAKHDVTSPGLFVVIINNRFGFSDPVPSYGSWPNLNYSHESDRLIRLVANSHSKHEILRGENLTPNQPNQLPNSQLYFDDFIDKVEEKIKEMKPSFLFFYIASHGDDDGNFILSAHPGSTTMCQDANCGRLNYGHHKGCRAGQMRASIESRFCHKRNVDEIQRKIQYIRSEDGRGFVMEGKPKIFINQFCRGSKTDGGRGHVIDVVDSGHFIDEVDSNTKRVIYLIPEADTVILNATITGHKSYIQGGRSWILERFEEEIRKLQKPTLSDQEVTKLTQQVPKLKSKFAGCKELEFECLIGGWLMDVFDRIVRVVGLTKEIRYADTGENSDKQIPELISNMTRRVSAFDMFR